MSDLIKLYEAVLSNEIAHRFSLAILILFAFAVLALIHQALLRSDRFIGFTRSAGTLFTTIGVLGTFFGIFIGLLEFDVANIDASIQHLLTGLKIAFSTSIVGIGAATVFMLTLIGQQSSECLDRPPHSLVTTGLDPVVHAD